MSDVSERHVQAIWYDANLRPKSLTTRRGSVVNVVYPGEWNLGAGPDFTGAVLEIGRERRRVVGDVEIHLCPSDWDFHGHGADARYRNVVAHVTWGCGPDPASLPSGCLSIWIGRFVMSNPGFSPDQIDLKAYPYFNVSTGTRPCEERLRGNPDQAQEILAEAGRYRLRMKARRISGRLLEPRFIRRGEQVFYEEVMSALGYSRNAVPFRRVAERIPICELPRETEVAKTALRVAGEFEVWDRGGRPNNSPERRLENAAWLFTATPVMKLARATDFSESACRSMLDAMCGKHYVGKGRAGAILANVIVPFALAAEHVSSLPDWLPPEDLSAPVRLTAFRLFGRDHNPAAFYARNGLLVQGLLQVHRDCCLRFHPICMGCRLAR